MRRKEETRRSNQIQSEEERRREDKERGEGEPVPPFEAPARVPARHGERRGGRPQLRPERATGLGVGGRPAALAWLLLHNARGESMPMASSAPSRGASDGRPNL